MLRGHWKKKKKKKKDTETRWQKSFKKEKEPYAPALIHCSTNQCLKLALLSNSLFFFFLKFIDMSSPEECVYTEKTHGELSCHIK